MPTRHPGGLCSSTVGWMRLASQKGMPNPSCVPRGLYNGKVRSTPDDVGTPWAVTPGDRQGLQPVQYGHAAPLRAQF